MEKEIRSILLDMVGCVKAKDLNESHYLQIAVDKLSILLETKNQKDCPACEQSKNTKSYIRTKIYMGHGAWSEDNFLEASDENKKYCQMCGKKYT